MHESWGIKMNETESHDAKNQRTRKQSKTFKLTLSLLSNEMREWGEVTDETMTGKLTGTESEIEIEIEGTRTDTTDVTNGLTIAPTDRIATTVEVPGSPRGMEMAGDIQEAVVCTATRCYAAAAMEVVSAVLIEATDDKFLQSKVLYIQRPLVLIVISPLGNSLPERKFYLGGLNHFYPLMDLLWRTKRPSSSNILACT